MIKQIKKTLFLAFIFVMAVQSTVFAGYTSSNDMFDGRKFLHTYYLYVNNVEIQTPTFIHERDLCHITYVPLKDIVTAMGDSFSMSGNKVIVTKKDNTKIVMEPNSINLTINGEPEQFIYKQDCWDGYTNHYPIIKNNTFYVPFNDYFSRIFGYEVHTERKKGPSTPNSISESIYIYIGKAPDRFYVPSEYPYVYQYQLPTEPVLDGYEIKLLPVEDFSKFKEKHTTKDPIKDFLHFYDTMPNFICSPPRDYPGYSSEPHKQRSIKFAEELRNGTYTVDSTYYGYDARRFYHIDFNSIDIGQSTEHVIIRFNDFIYKIWGTSSKVEIYDFNCAAAIHNILEYYMPNEGEVLFNKLRDNDFYWDKPVKYDKDNCTVTIMDTTGPSIIKIEWDK